MEQSHIDDGSTSRFIRKKPVPGSKSTEEDTAAEPPAPSLLPAVDDAAQKDRGGPAVISTTAKKTYSVNMCGAAVPHPAQRTKKTPSQTTHVNAVNVKGSPLAERKTKVRLHSFINQSINLY